MSALLWVDDVHTDTYVTETPIPTAGHTRYVKCSVPPTTGMHRYTETHRFAMAYTAHPRVCAHAPHAILSPCLTQTAPDHGGGCGRSRGQPIAPKQARDTDMFVDWMRIRHF